MFSSYDSIYFISCVLGMSDFAWHNPNPLYSLFKEHFLYSGKISPPEHIHIISYELRLVNTFSLYILFDATAYLIILYYYVSLLNVIFSHLFLMVRKDLLDDTFIK